MRTKYLNAWKAFRTVIDKFDTHWPKTAKIVHDCYTTNNGHLKVKPEWLRNVTTFSDEIVLSAVLAVETSDSSVASDMQSFKEFCAVHSLRKEAQAAASATGATKSFLEDFLSQLNLGKLDDDLKRTTDVRGFVQRYLDAAITVEPVVVSLDGSQDEEKGEGKVGQHILFESFILSLLFHLIFESTLP